MKTRTSTVACLGAAGLLAAAQAGAVSFTTFVSGGDLGTALGNTATIGFAYAGDKFVGSVYYGTNNNQLYSTNLAGTGVQAFGDPIAGAAGEIYVSSSLGLGGFGARDVFAGAENQSVVYHFNNDGTGQAAFASGLSGGVRSIAFDPYGAYGYDMIVATNQGNVYRVDGAGTATFLANVGEDAEGLSFAPQATGPLALGTLVVASESSGSLRAIAPDGTIDLLISGLYGAEMVSFVPLNLGVSGDPVEGFYAANYAQDVIKAPASDFAPYIGHIIITGETGHQVFDVNWDGTAWSSSTIGSFPAQPEDGIFVTASIIRPGCDQTDSCGTTVAEPGTLSLAGLGLVGVGLARRRRHRG